MRQFQPMKGTMAIIIVLAASTLAIGAAEARTSAGKQVSVAVPYADLNLQRPEGVRMLYERLQQAARQACDNNAMDADRNLAIKAAGRNCYRTALSGAVAEVNNEHLNRLHNKTL